MAKDAPAPDVTVVGVCVVLCNNGMLSKVWIDIDKVSAIAWTEGEIKGRSANPGHGSTKIPTTNKGEPDSCPPAESAAGETGLCWWDGSRWVCGD
jgi:hypothetical protein